jgi:hypothetical protein
MTTFWITTLALVSMSLAIAQDVPPPPPMRGEAASLKDTMRFLQDKLPGKVNYMMYRHDNITGADVRAKFTFEVWNVSADADQCGIDDHWRITLNEKIKPDEDALVNLKQVREVVVISLDQADQQAAAKNGHPEWSFKIDPPIFSVRAKRDGGQSAFDFYDETLANRVATALRHAVDLCGGGGNQEPF